MTNTHPLPPKEKKLNKKTPHRLEIRFTEAEWIEVLGAQCHQGLVGSWGEWEEGKKRRLPGHLGSRVLQQPPPPSQSSRWLSHWPGRWCAEHGQAWQPGHSVLDGGAVELGQVPTLMSVQKSSEYKGLFLAMGLCCI